MTQERERERTLNGRLGQRIDPSIGGVTGSSLMNTPWIVLPWIIVLVRTRTITWECSICRIFGSARAFTSKTDFSFLRLNQIIITSIFVTQLVWPARFDPNFGKQIWARPCLLFLLPSQTSDAGCLLRTLFCVVVVQYLYAIFDCHCTSTQNWMNLWAMIKAKKKTISAIKWVW